MSSFEGFGDKDEKFFKALAKNNDRAWFLAHKDQFEDRWNGPMKALLSDVREVIDRAYAHCELDEPKVFRIFRDVRFSKDKSPYKTHIGGFIPVKGKEKVTEVPMALYFQVGARETFGAAGHYMMSPPSLERFRVAVAEDKRGKELDKILVALQRKGFSTESHETLKRVPKAYDPDHPRAALLKRKGLVVTFPKMPAGLLATPKLTTWLATQCKVAAALVEWLVFATA
jgi:uncharacterized protein (TIGR02453 family)